MIAQEKVWDKEYSKNPEMWNLDTRRLPNILKNKRVLELGVGNGKTLRTILKQNPKEAIAIDFSEIIINKIKDNFPKTQTQFIKANIDSIPFKNEEFDVIVCYYVLNNLLHEGRIKAIKEIFRVLKNKGTVLFEDFAEGDFRELNNKETAEKHTIKKKNGMICHFFSPNELETLFKEFSKNKFAVKISHPITKKPKLERKIIHGLATK